MRCGLALFRFASWCIHRDFWWFGWDLSWISATHIGARQLNKPDIEKWTSPLFDAFIYGAWFLYWTSDTLYWVSKPAVHVEINTESISRLHCANGPAVESDIEGLYFWHGVMVPAFVVMRPEWIKVDHIEQETNAEVRRVMIERYGQARYLIDSKAQEIHADSFGKLYRKEIADDESIVMVKVRNSTPEPDGSIKDYFIRVSPDVKTAREAVAWTFGLRSTDYAPEVET